MKMISKRSQNKLKTAHKRADKILLQKEGKIDKFYDRHTADIIKIFNTFYKAHKDEFEKKLQAYKDGKITKDEYRQYMLSKTIFSDDWRKTVDKMTTAISDMNQKALNTVVSDDMGDIYIDNYNTTIKAIGGELLES